MKEEVPMKRKIPKKQVIILCGGITAAIILVSLVMLIIRKTGKNDNIAGTKIVEETTVSLDRTTGMEKETTSKETATSTEQVTTERELETTTDKEKTTTELIITTTNPPTTAKPAEPVTQPVKEVVTNPPTTVVNNNQYRDPYTGDIISKEEYDSIMNEMNNPEPATTSTPKENIYVLNDDGTLNFKKSKINRPNSNEETEFLSLCKNSNPIKEIIGENLYPYITIFSYSWSSSSSYPTFYACINNEYWLVIGCYDNWNFKQGGDIVLCTNGLPVKNAW